MRASFRLAVLSSGLELRDSCLSAARRPMEGKERLEGVVFSLSGSRDDEIITVVAEFYLRSHCWVSYRNLKRDIGITLYSKVDGSQANRRGRNA